VHNKPFEDVDLRRCFLIVEFRKVDFGGEGDRMVEFDLGECLEIEDKPLKMYE
jgi:hypothetical protein